MAPYMAADFVGSSFLQGHKILPDVWSSIPIQCMIFATTGYTALYVAFHVYAYIQKRSPALKSVAFEPALADGAKMPSHSSSFQCSFPLGSLGRWDDLLSVNRDFAADTEVRQVLKRKQDTSSTRIVEGVIGQWTFFRASVAVIKAEHVAKVFRSSTSRTLDPPILNTIGLRHFKKFFGSKSVGVSEGKVWKAGRKGKTKYADAK